MILHILLLSLPQGQMLPTEFHSFGREMVCVSTEGCTLGGLIALEYCCSQAGAGDSICVYIHLLQWRSAPVTKGSKSYFVSQFGSFQPIALLLLDP